METCKKLALLGFARLFWPGTIQQLVIGTLVVLCSWGALLLRRPYRAKNDNFFAFAIEFSLVVFFISSVAFKFGALADAARDLLPPADRSLATFDPGMVSGMLLFVLISGLLMLVVLQIVEVMEDRKKHMLLGPEDFAALSGMMKHAADEAESARRELASDRDPAQMRPVR